MKGGIISAFLVALIAVAFTIASEKPDYIPYSEKDDVDAETASRFVGGNGETTLTGYWHLPTSSNESSSENLPPVILLAHGLGLVQGKSLSSFVSAFQEAGYAVVTFDYATFGRSDGLPRHQIHPINHVADVQAAIAMIKDEGKNRGVDTSRIGLWGTSLGGGHVLMAASNSDPSVKAVVAQVPHVASGLESVLGAMMSSPVSTGLSVIKFLAGLLKLIVSKVVLQEPAYFPIVGKPGSAAIMQNAGDAEGYLGILNPGGEVSSGWRNAATTESGVRLLFYRPLSSVSEIKLPVLLISAESDTLCPAKFVEDAKDRIKNSELFYFPNLGHFDIYKGEPLKAMLAKQIDFFHKNLN